MQAAQFNQVYEESPADKKKRLEFEQAFKDCVLKIFELKGKKLLVERYDQWVKKLAKNLDSLDQQVRKLTAGDLRIAKKKDGKIEFDSSRDPKKLEEYGDHDNDQYDSGDEDATQKKRLFKKCFNKKNIALGRMIKTTEKLNNATQKYKSDLEKLLLRAKLDRPSMIQEKFRIIWREDDGVKKEPPKTDKQASKVAQQDIQVIEHGRPVNYESQISLRDAKASQSIRSNTIKPDRSAKNDNLRMLS